MSELMGRGDELAGALSALSDGRGVVFGGEAGVGKTRLLSECAAAHAARSGCEVMRLQTSPTTSSISLWPFHHLLPQSPSEDLANLSNHIRRHFEFDDGTRVLLVVDDADHLDQASLGMIEYLLANGRVSLAATVRSGARGVSAVHRVGLRFDVEEIELGPLDAAACSALLEHLLSGPVDDETLVLLTDASRGNPLLLRELVLDAVENETLVSTADGWTLTPGNRGVFDSIGDRTRLCVRRRLARLGDDERALVDMLAVAGPIRPDLLPPESTAHMESLEARRLITVTMDRPGAWSVQLDHPVVGEVVRSDMTGSTRLSVIGALISYGRVARSRSPGDGTRMAYWAEEIGEELSEDEWLTAVTQALAAYDFAVAERWCRKALDVAPDSHRANLALGRVLRHRRRPEEAATAFQAAQDHATTDGELADTTIEHAALVALRLGDPEAAVAMLHTAAAEVTDADAAACLRSEAAMFATLLGRFDSETLVRESRETSNQDDSTRWLLGLNELYARTMLGRVSSLDELVDTTLRAYPSIAGRRPQEYDFVVGLRGAARLQRSEIRTGVEELYGVVRERRDTGRYRGISAMVLGLLLGISGDARARAEALDGIEQHEWMDPLGTAPIAVSIASLIEADFGDVAAADDLASRGEAIGSEPWCSIWAGRARARVHYLNGDDTAAIAAAVAATGAALDSSHAAYAAITAHDLVRYGDASRGVSLLDAALAGTEACTFLGLLRDHARAVATGNPAGVSAAAMGFAAAGAPLLAVQASHDWARAARDGDDLPAARLAVFVASMIARADAAEFAVPVPPDVPDLLSSREADVARWAVEGERSRRIAERLDLSARTVDNHLRNVYRKLEVSGRDELRDRVLLPMDGR